MKYKYKEKVFEIKFCDGNTTNWGDHLGMLHVENDQPYNFGYTNSVEEMKERIAKVYDEYHNTIPKNEAGWLAMFQACVIQDGYEDWHIDKELAMRLLKLYKEKG